MKPGFTDPIDVAIKFSLMRRPRTEQRQCYKFSYATFFSRGSRRGCEDRDDAIALAHLPGTVNNPVTGSGFINIKTAEIRALGISVLPPSAVFDGVISINAALTDVGSNGSSGPYSFQSVIMHEINESWAWVPIWRTGFFADPAPEDLFRYDSNGLVVTQPTRASRRSFSIDGSTQLAEFNNQTSGGDWGTGEAILLLASTEGSGRLCDTGRKPCKYGRVASLTWLAMTWVAPEPGTIFFSGAAC